MPAAAALAAILLVSSASAALAQGAAARDTATLPKELVEALFGAFGGRVDIVPGRLPAGFPADLVPRGATVLGGIDYA
jgi:hypothetical protein